MKKHPFSQVIYGHWFVASCSCLDDLTWVLLQPGGTWAFLFYIEACAAFEVLKLPMIPTRHLDTDNGNSCIAEKYQGDLVVLRIGGAQVGSYLGSCWCAN